MTKIKELVTASDTQFLFLILFQNLKCYHANIFQLKGKKKKSHTTKQSISKYASSLQKQWVQWLITSYTVTLQAEDN